eukprot:CAMPEP_0172303152 /NCGR_PEP_ID=MMETSP1058-20130122/4733_1 /TAXON_ID=83371 /ORGANISM="Detonula confervacea, Strain CCMP 353" /LENGTH=514 /DNA_ID=CAMNT_0013013869 /DNA_START=209 /DNA_END=1753 /DNA_ORIENTATION=-
MSSPTSVTEDDTGMRRRKLSCKKSDGLQTDAVDRVGTPGRKRRGNNNNNDDDDDDDDEVPKNALTRPKVSYSSGVAFYPPSDNYWRIGGKWYDFTEFLPKHPGGATVLQLVRDRFEDGTFVFESHHTNYKRARAIIRKYEVPVSVVRASGLRRRPTRLSSGEGFGQQQQQHHDRHLDAENTPVLLSDDAFYSVMRRRVTDHLKRVGSPGGGPTLQCIVFFWISFVAWLSCYTWLLFSGSVLAAVCFGFSSSWLGAFGHNWVHQPNYKLWAKLSLDTIGFSSDGWFREHNLQHHMYTNTPWDNHFEGTAPWLVTDPTIKRNLLQRYIMPYLNPLLLSFGLYGNYMAHLVETVKGNEVISPWKLLLPLEIAAMMYNWGWRGLLLMYISHAILGVYYFTIALMNHNTEHCLNVKARNGARDWGEAQLHSSADWSVGLPFWAAGVYLWLNYHTVHHLFPLVDFSHHHAIQRILIDTCEEFGIEYEVGEPLDIYIQMVHTFSSPSSLMQEIMVYGGGGM